MSALGHKRTFSIKKKDRLVAVFPKSNQVQLGRSTGARRQPSARAKGEVHQFPRRARGDLQDFIGNVESKDLSLSLFKSYHIHGIAPSRSEIMLNARLRCSQF
jgi:hypothetical protein